MTLLPIGKAYSIIIGMRSTIEDCNTTDE